MNKEYFTTGELAKLTGVSYKTIRHYFETELLVPEEHTDAGYRLYSTKSVEKLQRILMLKYLDFSLDEIKEMLKEEHIADSFKKQEKLLEAQAEHINQLIQAVKEVQKVNENERWNKILEIIHMTQQKEEIVKQYKESTNLEKRINIHTYSTSKESFYQWVLDGLQLEQGMKILDVGCGNGMLWRTMCDQLPCNLKIFMVDSSAKMLEAAQKNLAEYQTIFQDKNIKFVYKQQDVENINIQESGFDRIIANHMLYHISNEKRNQLLVTCENMLANKGMFYASTVGKTHMKELFTLMKKFDERIDRPNWMSENFELENGGEQLEKVFSNVSVEEQKNDLLVPNPQAITDYIESLPGNIREVIRSRKEEWDSYVNGIVSKEKPYFIHKSTGAFKAYKKE